MKSKKIQIFLPCLNEEKTLEKVIQDFILELPQAEIIVFDNGSEDSSLQIARKNNTKMISKFNVYICSYYPKHLYFLFELF